MVDFSQGNRLNYSVNQFRCVLDKYCRESYYPLEYSPEYLAQDDAALFNQGVGERYFYNDSFVKLREVSATYTLPERWFRGAGISRASLTVAARELYTWTTYPGPDPEVRYGTGNVVGTSDTFDQAVIPPLSRFVATFNLTF
jgi:hypothetical protein